MPSQQTNIEENYTLVLKKISRFVRYYYLDKIFRGGIAFALVSLSYLIFILIVERGLWLSVLGRHILFFSLLAVCLLCFIFWVGVPLLRYYKVLKPTSTQQASRQIGEKLKDIDDKLLNLLQLYEQSETFQASLLLASIEQKSKELSRFSFTKAVDFRTTLLLSKYLWIPIGFFAMLLIFDGVPQYWDSFRRISNYQKEYLPPAPFQFYIENKSLTTIANKSFVLKIKLEGKDLPKKIEIVFQEHKYYCKSGKDKNTYTYKFSKTDKDISFYLQSGKYRSETSVLRIKHPPIIDKILLVANYPSYTKKPIDSFYNTYAVEVPRGTYLDWHVYYKNTNSINLKIGDSVSTLQVSDSPYIFQHQIFQTGEISFSTSNMEFEHYETLTYKIQVKKDLPPRIKVVKKIDSVFIDKYYHHGILIDDYGIAKLELVYCPRNNPKARKYQKIPIPVDPTRQEFYYTFPHPDLSLTPDKEYLYFFRVYDNNPFPKKQSAQSQNFYYNVLSKEEIEKQYLQKEKNSLIGLDSVLTNYQIEKDKAFFINNQINPESTKFKDFLNKEMHRQKMMERFSKQLQQQQISGSQSTILKERLQKEIAEAKSRREILEQIKKLSEKTSPKLKEKLQKLQKMNKVSKRNMNQILELTKRNYLYKKIQNIIQNIEKLADTIKARDYKPKKQQTYQKEFQDIRQQLEETEKFNQTLNREMNIKRDQFLERNIEKDLQDAQQYYKQNQNSKSQDIHKQVTQKLRRMSKNLKNQKASQMKLQLKMDIASLRQIMENIMRYSFEQETLIDQTTKTTPEEEYSEIMKKQNELKQVFQHIDDSLYNLSLSQPTITEKINKQIEEVHYYNNASLEKLSERQNFAAASDQQFALSYTNELGAFISDALDNLKIQIGNSKGQNEEMQLPDIIKQQQNILDRAESRLQELLQEEQTSEERLSKEQMELYKAQQKLKESLEKWMQNKETSKQQGKGISKDVDKVKKDLIEKGFTEDLVHQMKRIYKKLLEYQSEEYEQGRQKQRQSKTNQKVYIKPPNRAVEYFKEGQENRDALFRESLPVQDSYQSIINEYFSESIEF